MINTKEWPGRYHLNRQIHGNICRTYELEINGCQRTVEAEHPGLELWLIREGSQSLKFRAKEVVAGPGQVFLFNGRESHTELHKRSLKCRADIVVICSDWLKTMTDDVGFDIAEMVFEKVSFNPSPDLVHSLERLFALRQTPEVSSISLDCIASTLALELLVQQAHSNSVLLKRCAGQGRFPAAFIKAKAIMRDLAFSQEVSLQRVAELAGMSKFHFLRHFKENVGLTPMQYLTILRVDMAKNRLVQGDKVIAAAFASGFADLSTFNKAFRRNTGITPSSYRSRYGSK